MSEQTAKWGLCYKHLQLAYERNSEDEIRHYLVKGLMGVYEEWNPRKSYGLLLSTSKVNESNIHILNERFSQKQYSWKNIFLAKILKYWFYLFTHFFKMK